MLHLQVNFYCYYNGKKKKENAKYIFHTVRGSTGINLAQGPPSYESVKAFPKDESRTCKTMLFSPDGKYFAWVNGATVKISLCENWKIVGEIARSKVCAIQFSTRSTYLATWEPSFGN